MSNPSPGYSITVRVTAPVGADTTAALVGAVASVKGVLTALDVMESHADSMVVDVTCDASDSAHAEQIATAIADVPGVKSARSATAHSCSTSAGSSKWCRRFRSNTVTTSPVHTHQELRGCAWPSPRTRRTCDD